MIQQAQFLGCRVWGLQPKFIDWLIDFWFWQWCMPRHYQCHCRAHLKQRVYQRVWPLAFQISEPLGAKQDNQGIKYVTSVGGRSHPTFLLLLILTHQFICSKCWSKLQFWIKYMYLETRYNRPVWLDTKVGCNSFIKHRTVCGSHHRN